MDSKNEQKTLAQLEQFQDELTAQLETALSSESDIDPDLVIKIRERLAQMPLQIAAARISDTKKRLNEIHDELLSAEQTKQLIRKEQIERKNELNLKLDEIQPYYDRYNDCSLRLTYVANDLQLLLGARREHKALLFSLSDEIRK